MIATYSVGVFLEAGLAVGLIIGFIAGSTYRGLIDRWKFRKQKKGD